MNKKVFFLIVGLIVLCLDTKAQDPHFSQFYANPLYTNPALAGTVVCPRFSLSYRDQWPALGAFKTFSASYDQYFDALSGGIGVMVMSDAQSDYYRTNTAALIYSLRLKLTRDIFLNLAAQASVTNRSLDWDELSFPDMIDPRYGFIYSTMADRPDDLSHTYVDFAAGLVAYGENWYVGASVANLTRPNDGFISLFFYFFKIYAFGGSIYPFYPAEQVDGDVAFVVDFFQPGGEVGHVVQLVRCCVVVQFQVFAVVLFSALVFR